MGNRQCRMGADRIAPRRPLLYAAFVAVTVGVGLASRRFGHSLPPFVAAYLPDSLYALMVFWLGGLLWRRAHTAQIAAAALLFCYAIEVSQLYQAPWINAVRHTVLGGLILGFGFLWSDIVCYTVGVGAGIVAETLMRRKFGRTL